MAARSSVQWSGHAQELCSFLANNMQLHSDTVISVQDGEIPVNSLVLASCSPLLSSLISASTTDRIILQGVNILQARYLVEFMYKGRIDRISREEMKGVEELGSVLGIVGISSGLVEPCEVEGDDDVFEESAMDLSQNRSVLGENNPRAERRIASLNKISEALSRSPSISKPSDIAGPSIPNLKHETLHRDRKPRPLTDLPSTAGESVDLSPTVLKLKTPVLVSPDCRVLEDRIRHLIDPANPDLRNLSVSSADFNFDASLPGTPGYRHKFSNVSENLKREERVGVKEELCAGEEEVDVGDNQAVKTDVPNNEETRSGEDNIPVINIIKPEPADPDIPIRIEENINAFSINSGLSSLKVDGARGPGGGRRWPGSWAV